MSEEQRGADVSTYESLKQRESKRKIETVRGQGTEIEL